MQSKESLTTLLLTIQIEYPQQQTKRTHQHYYMMSEKIRDQLKLQQKKSQQQLQQQMSQQQQLQQQISQHQQLHKRQQQPDQQGGFKVNSNNFLPDIDNKR